MLSHINQQSSALMIELLQALGRDLRAVAIDYPSHGHSDHIDWQPAIEDYARCVIEVMDALGIERASAMGEAVGAAVSGADALRRAFHLRPPSRALAVEVPAGQGRDRAWRALLHELGARQ
jgi:pimeloyl-ACP methyl ester carboxylesterase